MDVVFMSLQSCADEQIHSLIKLNEDQSQAGKIKLLWSTYEIKTLYNL